MAPGKVLPGSFANLIHGKEPLMKLRIGILSTASIVPRLIGAVRAAEVYLSDSHSPYDGFTVSSIASRSLKNARRKALLWNVPKAFGSYERTDRLGRG